MIVLNEEQELVRVETWEDITGRPGLAIFELFEMVQKGGGRLKKKK